jgi:diketogulonate reductase-like aldo/keto reductase
MDIVLQTKSDKLLQPFIYGTAWKEDNTERLTTLALQQGFRAIDTANQRKHYYEQGVGFGIQSFLAKKTCQRTDLFIQTKFTYVSGQDERLPYDKHVSLTEQVEQSLRSSLEHLQTDYLDSYILHGPYYTVGIGDEDIEVWRVMEELVEIGLVRYIGVSNISAQQLKILMDKASIQPKFVQNRCFALLQWDKEVRDICSKSDFVYQGFSLLTANHPYLQSPPIRSLAQKYNTTIPQLIFRFSQQTGILPLTGTTDAKHMAEDLSIYNFDIEEGDRRIIEQISSH